MTTVSPEKIAAAKSLAIISAVEPDFVGQEVGITSFGNEWWMSDQVGVDINAIILDTIKGRLKRDVKLVHGRDVKLRPDRKFEKLYELKDYLESDEVKQANREALAKLGREWGVDTILLIQSVQVSDWMRRTIAPVYGVGLFARSGAGRLCYAVLRVRVFDCATGELGFGTIVKHAREVYATAWHGSWEKFTEEEKRVVKRTLPMILRETVPYMVAKVGLASEPKGEPPLKINFFGTEMPPSIIPEENEFPIPAWASAEQAREAVLFAFKDREWTVTKDADGVLVGTHPKGQKEAVCTVRIAKGNISMTPECFEIKPDGSRMAVEYLTGWQENLKESLYGFLLKVPDAAEKQQSL